MQKNLEKKEHINWAIQELYSWMETFDTYLDCEITGEGIHESECFDSINELIQKLENGNCAKKDYEEVIFHLWQMRVEEILK